MRRHKFLGLRVWGALGAGFLVVVAVAAQPVAVAGPKLRANVIEKAALGVFTGSDGRGTTRLAEFERWLGRDVTVGRTYIPGETWAAFLGPDFILKPWTRWRAEKPGRVLAINVPMVAPNEGGLSDPSVAVLLNAGANGAFDLTFRQLADRLVAEGAGDSIIVLGWEMNGTTYSSRCAPDPVAWKTYWRRIVTAMRAVPGQKFRFDFTAARGRDAIPWTQCYPGDDVVDIIGLDSYDQPPADGFRDYVSQPYGLQHHADFAAAHGKPMSFPEWGLFRYGDRPQYVRGMLDWIGKHNVVYHSLSDYCPHGVWQCAANPRSADGYRTALRQMLPGTLPKATDPPLPSPSAPVPLPSASLPSAPVPAPSASLPSAPVPAPSASLPVPAPSASLPSAPVPAPSASLPVAAPSATLPSAPVPAPSASLPVPAPSASLPSAPVPAPSASLPVPAPSASLPVAAPSATLPSAPVPAPSASLPVPAPSASLPSAPVPAPSASLPVPAPSASLPVAAPSASLPAPGLPLAGGLPQDAGTVVPSPPATLVSVEGGLLSVVTGVLQSLLALIAGTPPPPSVPLVELPPVPLDIPSPTVMPPAIPASDDDWMS
ncbi:glycoside hydrolase family 26 protein [Nonomuraea typhae]|uniref:glycoside hydrolase family 26 protein n=1 Tax=Nonomuraea typhae TaxID=2603600 RepID=UPI0012FCD8B9|nr:glycosyl hydrolase [Nonomuraea typhae]